MADNDRPSLNVQERSERGSRETRRLRREGLIPGVLYGGSHDETVTFKVNHRDLRSVLVDGSALIDVKIGGEKSVPAILKDQQVNRCAAMSCTSTSSRFASTRRSRPPSR